MSVIGKSVRHFLLASGEPVNLPLTVDDSAEIGRALMLIGTATDDFESALSYRERAVTAKQGADLVFLIVATMERFGLSFDDVFAEVNRSNLSRIDPATGTPFERDEKTGHINRGPQFYDPSDAISEIVDTPS
jgi:predicted HAD superfamily Cof-like phosphohydrolase